MLFKQNSAEQEDIYGIELRKLISVCDFVLVCRVGELKCTNIVELFSIYTHYKLIINKTVFESVHKVDEPLFLDVQNLYSLVSIIVSKVFVCFFRIFCYTIIAAKLDTRTINYSEQ